VATGGKRPGGSGLPQEFVAGRPGSRSLRRLLFAASFALVIVLVIIGIFLWRNQTAPTQPWFAGYVDATVSPQYPFATPASDTSRNVVLSFIVADPANPCVPHWGTEYSLDDADTLLGLDTKIALLRKNGGHPAVSFGGASNTELATSCIDEPSLLGAYSSVVDRYQVNTVDFDIEGDNLADTAAGVRRAKAVAQLQQERSGRGKPLDVWLTLPVSPHGMTDPGVAEVETMLRAGVDLAGVNIMTMNYGDSRLPGQSMLQASEDAAVATQSQLGIIYQRAGQDLDSQAVWAKIGLTPMIGINEISTDIFELDDAKAFADFAAANHVGRMSMWSDNRDTPCPAGTATPAVATHVCSGVAQEAGAFGAALAAPFKGTLK